MPKYARSRNVHIWAKGMSLPMKRKFYNSKNLDKIESYNHEFSVEMEPLDQHPVTDNLSSIGLIRWYLLTIIVFTIIIFRLSYLQITEGKINQNLAEGNRIRLQEITAPRGNFYDREGNLMSLNVAQSNLVIYPLEVSKNYQDKLIILNKISEICSLKFTDIVEKVLKANRIEPIILKPKLAHEESLGLQVEIKNISGVEVENIPVKKYQNIPGIGHILGYVGKVSEEDLKADNALDYNDLVGKSGLEKTYDSDLRGSDGFKKNEVNSRGILERMISQKNPEIGSDIYLSFSSKIQVKANELLKKILEEKKLSKGIVIVTNPQTGKILSMLSLPDFDVNLMQGSKSEIDKIFNDPNNPLLNRAISGQYPPGSSIKPIIAASALQENIVNPSFAIDTPSEITIGDSTFPDWKDHGTTDIKRAIAESNNIFFYMLGGGWKNIRGLGVEKIEKYLKYFGFGAGTGIDLTGEKEGLVPNSDWKQKIKNEKWYIGDTYHLSIGQGDLLVTPLQLLIATNVIINNGKLIQPSLVEKIKNEKSEKPVKIKVNQQNFMDENNLQIVREGMRLAVTEGSARLLGDITDKDGRKVEVGAKTGTAQIGSKNQAGNYTTHAWITAFAPYTNPEISIIVLIEKGGEGYQVAGPVAKGILEYYFNDYQT